MSDWLTRQKDGKSFFPVTCYVHRMIGNVDGCTSVMEEKVLILMAIFMFKNIARSGHLTLNASFANKVHSYTVPLPAIVLSSAIIFLYIS